MLAETLKKALDSKGWSARELGRRLGVQPSTVTRWLNGETLPGEDGLKPLAKMLTLNYDTVLEQYLHERDQREKVPNADRIDALEVRVAGIEARLDEIIALLSKPKRR